MIAPGPGEGGPVWKCKRLQKKKAQRQPHHHPGSCFTGKHCNEKANLNVSSGPINSGNMNQLPWKLPLRGCWEMFSRSLKTYKIDFKGWVLSLNQSFFESRSLSDVDGCGLLVLAGKVWRLLKRLAETQKSLVSHMKKSPKYADSGNYFLNERNSCKESDFYQTEKTGRLFSCICFASFN